MAATVITFAIIYLLSFFLSRQGFFVPAGFLLSFCALYLYYQRSLKLKKPFSIDALFSLSWVCGTGLSCMKLSYLAVDWEIKTWVVIGLTYIVFTIAFDTAGTVLSKRYTFTKETEYSVNNHFTDKDHIFRLILLITAVYLSAFIFEVIRLKYIPLFTIDTPHAYSEFHVTGVHYFTVLFTFIPSLSILYFHSGKGLGTITLKNKFIVLTAVVFSLVTPVLLVSRFQLLFAVILGFFTYVSVNNGKAFSLAKKRNVILLLTSLAALLALYIFITIERAHSAEYLLSIFEIKNKNIPVWIAQPYIYVANNFDNLNCLIRDLSSHSHGLRQLYPFTALTGMKFLHPELIVPDIYITKTELTTLTLVYDAYYDFGIIGTILFSLILGILSAVFESFLFEKASGRVYIMHIIKAQFIFYLTFSFFTTWFSNTTTWFYLGISVIIGIIEFLLKRACR